MAGCLNLRRFSDHRWAFHSERVQPADFENSPVNHLTELQSVSPQQLIQPYRFSSESLPLHLDPPLAPLSVSPQVSSCLKMYDGATTKRQNLYLCDLKNWYVPILTEMLSMIMYITNPKPSSYSKKQGQFWMWSYWACNSVVLHWWKTIVYYYITVIHIFAHCISPESKDIYTLQSSVYKHERTNTRKTKVLLFFKCIF